MSTEKKWDLLYIQDTASHLNAETEAFDSFFKSVDKVTGNETALKRLYINKYDIVIHDSTVNFRNSIAFLKEIKEMKPELEVFAFASLSDEDKVGHVIDAGVNAFVLTADQFDQALETVAQIEISKKEAKTK